MLTAFVRFILTHVYVRWSLLYRRMYESKWKDVPLKKFPDLRSLAAYLYKRSVLWREDSWQQAFDAISSPGYVQAIFEMEQDLKHGLDCDEFAIYAANVVRDSQLSTASYLLTVTWREGLKPCGHNVCLLRLRGRWAAMDYGMPYAHGDTVDEVAKTVMQHASKHAAPTFLAWAAYTPDLAHVTDLK